MKKLLLLVCIVYMSAACGTEVVDRRSFISSNSTAEQISEGNSEEKTIPAEPAEENQQPPEPTLPLSTLEWDGVNTIGTNTLGVLSITREGEQ